MEMDLPRLREESVNVRHTTCYTQTQKEAIIWAIDRGIDSNEMIRRFVQTQLVPLYAKEREKSGTAA